MSVKQPVATATLMLATMIILITAGCKKSNVSFLDTQQKANIPMPDSVMFAGTGNSDTTTIYLLDAANGSLFNKYSYRHNKQVDSYIPLVGNGFLYMLENTKINALNIRTGAIMWSDSVKNATQMHAILHNDTFYGLSTVYYNNLTVFAMDATKQTDTFLWQYTLSSTYASSNITYHNDLIYITSGNSISGNLTVLDAKTGTVKWTLNKPCSIASLKNGLIISGMNLLDAITGSVMGSVPSSLLVSNATQTASLIYADKNLFFIRVVNVTNNYNTITSKLNAYNAVTHVLKWSINSGGGYSGYNDTTKTVDQILGDQLILRTDLTLSSGKYGYFYTVTYSGLNLGTGTEKWSYPAGIRGQNFQIANNMYSCGTNTLNLAAGQPASSTINAADLNTGKFRWTSNNKLTFSVGGSIAACISVKGKGYAFDIQ